MKSFDYVLICLSSTFVTMFKSMQMITEEEKWIIIWKHCNDIFFSLLHD